MGPARGPKLEREVAPPFALDASGLMEDDAYNGHGEDEKRGLEEEGSESTLESDDKAEAVLVRDDQDTSVNFFA